jgi:exodeoxyribonuclease (lambda-induced)
MNYQTLLTSLPTKETVNISEELVYHYDIEQRSEEWHAQRIGKITGSNIYKLFGTKQAKEKYLADKASEIVTSCKSDSDENVYNFHIQRGVQYEDKARELYSLQTFSIVKECGLVQSGEYIAYSPDGLIDPDGLLEIKIPDSGKYLLLVIEISKHGIEKIPYEHQLQMQLGMYVCERKWCDYVLYNPKHDRLFIFRVYLDDKIQTQIHEVLKSSISYIQNLVSEYNNLSLS